MSKIKRYRLLFDVNNSDYIIYLSKSVSPTPQDIEMIAREIGYDTGLKKCKINFKSYTADETEKEGVRA